MVWETASHVWHPARAGVCQPHYHSRSGTIELQSGIPMLRSHPWTCGEGLWEHQDIKQFEGDCWQPTHGSAYFPSSGAHGSTWCSHWSQNVIPPFGVLCPPSGIPCAGSLALKDKASTSDFYAVWHIKICWWTLLEALKGLSSMEPIMFETYDTYNIASEVFFNSCSKQLHQHM